MGSFGARDAIFPLTLRLEFIEPSTTIVHEPPLFERGPTTRLRRLLQRRSGTGTPPQRRPSTTNPTGRPVPLKLRPLHLGATSGNFFRSDMSGTPPTTSAALVAVARRQRQ